MTKRYKNFRVWPELADKLSAKAAARGVSESQIVQEALEEYVAIKDQEIAERRAAAKGAKKSVDAAGVIQPKTGAVPVAKAFPRVKKPRKDTD